MRLIASIMTAFPRRRPPFPGLIIVTLAIAFVTLSVPLAMVIVAGLVEHNLSLRKDGVGLIQDWNILSMFLVFPIELFLLNVVWRRLYAYRDTVIGLATGDGRQGLASQCDSAICEPWSASGLCSVVVRWLVVTACWSFLVLNAYNRYYRTSVIYFERFWTSSEFIVTYWITLAYTVLVWGVLTPYLVIKLVEILIAIYRINRLMITSGSVRLVPLAPDHAGGLRSLGRLALLMSLMAIPLQLHAVAYYYWIPKINQPFLVGSTAALIATLLLFTVPIAFTHQVMKALKERMLQGIADAYNREYLAVVDGSVDSAARLKTLGDLKELYIVGEGVGTWPFNLQTFTTFVLAVVAPLLPIAAKILVERK